MILRARLLVVVAVLVGVVIVSTEFPLGELLHERASVRLASAQLTRLDSENRLLAGEIAALHDDSTVAAIAHADYGLVGAGDESVVVLPSPHSRAAGPLGTRTVPLSDLVPTDAIVSPDGSGPSTPTPSFWSRLLQRLEFWKAIP